MAFFYEWRNGTVDEEKGHYTVGALQSENVANMSGPEGLANGEKACFAMVLPSTTPHRRQSFIVNNAGLLQGPSEI